MSYFIPCLSAFCACIGFALIYQLRGKKIIIAALCGTFAWAVYLISAKGFGSSELAAYFLAGGAAALYAELAATRYHMPVTVCLIPGIIPTVPGTTIYRTMRECLLGNAEGFLLGGIDTLKIGGAIALGLIFVSSCIRIVRAMLHRHKQGKKLLTRS